MVGALSLRPKHLTKVAETPLPATSLAPHLRRSQPLFNLEEADLKIFFHGSLRGKVMKTNDSTDELAPGLNQTSPFEHVRGDRRRASEVVELLRMAVAMLSSDGRSQLLEKGSR